MLSKEVNWFVLSIVITIFPGCGAGYDKIFDKYGIYYGVSPEGFIAAQYRRPPGQRDTNSLRESFTEAAKELDGVRRGKIPIRNGLQDDLAKCNTVTIIAVEIHDAGERTQHEENVAIVAFPISQLEYVAKNGPTAEMSISVLGLEAKDMITIARAEHKRLERDALKR